MDRSLINFLNHGLLPFTGRAAEIARIEEFWRETAQAPGLRAMLVTGEAGIGKSRLIEEVAKRIAGAGGVIVQIRLYPDSTTSIVPMLAGALARSATVQQLLRADPEETMAAVAAALLRICGLRPTLLIIEDFHLLAGETLTDFAALLDRMADEPISLLLAARPVDLAARGLLERYLVDEMELEGLPDSDVADLCRAVLGTGPVDEQIVKALRERTLGNTLALRSALRGAVKSGVVSVNRGGRSPSARIDRRAFIDTLERNVRLLSEGMVAHLNDRERQAAGRLACLGEVFGRETAAFILNDAAQALETLTFKGIIHTPSTPPTAFPGGESALPPLAFTHNLLHRYFVECAAVDADALPRLLAANLPLYSTIPFQLLTAHIAETTIDTETGIRAISRTLQNSSALDDSRNWRFYSIMVDTAWAVFERIRAELTADRHREILTRLVSHKLNNQRREPTAEYESLVLQFDELTADPPDESTAERRLTALVYLRRYYGRRAPEHIPALWEEVEQIIQRYPRLGHVRSYVGFLRDTVRAAILDRDRATWRKVETCLQTILDDPETSPRERLVARRLLTPYMLTLFEDEMELERRLNMLDTLEADDNVSSDLRIWKIGLLNDIGRLDEALEAITRFVPMFQERGLKIEALSCQHLAQYIRAVFGGDPEKAIAEMLSSCAKAPEHLQTKFRLNAAQLLVGGALLRDDTALAERAVSAFSCDLTDMLPARKVLLLLGRNSRVSIAGTLDGADEISKDLHRLAITSPDDAAAAHAETRSIVERVLSGPMLTTETLLEKRATMDLALTVGEEFAAPLRPLMRETVERMLGWLEDRNLSSVMSPLLARYADLFPKNMVTAWRARIAAIARQRESDKEGEEQEPLLRVSMLGSISAQVPGEEPVRLRGAQLCTLLGLLVANHLLARPLSHREFTSIAIGLERDPDKVRKSLNFAVFRLREALGSDAVDTSGETPELRLDRVSVDLIDAHRHLRAAADALRDGALMRAVPELLQTLEISAGRVPFPTLYDEFFESAREDFETELRETVVRLSRSLLRQEDAASAEELLERAFEAMPDDEEVADLLRQTLRRLGKRTEATRVGMKVAEALEE